MSAWIQGQVVGRTDLFQAVLDLRLCLHLSSDAAWTVLQCIVQTKTVRGVLHGRGFGAFGGYEAKRSILLATLATASLHHPVNPVRLAMISV